MTRAAPLLVILLALSVTGRAAAWQDGSTCVTCHEVEISEPLARPVPEWRESVHAAHLVSCDGCHGGDPRLEDGDASMSEAAGFLADPSRAEMADACGACHEAVAESFSAGRFGRALARGMRVATCATCHMQDGHRILASLPEQIVTRETCPGCPSVSDPERSVVLLHEVRSAEEQLLSGVAAVEAKGIELTDFRRESRRVHEAFTRSVHEFDGARIDAARSRALTGYEGLAAQVARLHGEANGRRRLGIGMIAALTLLLVGLVLTLRGL